MKFVQREYAFSAATLPGGLLMHTLPRDVSVRDQQRKMYNLRAEGVCFITSGIEIFLLLSGINITDCFLYVVSALLLH
jgi:hypothetical protein